MKHGNDEGSVAKKKGGLDQSNVRITAGFSWDSWKAGRQSRKILVVSVKEKKTDF